MPRKRKTKGVATKSRPQLRLPDGSVGNDYQQELKQEKLSVILRDFDEEVEMRIKQLREDADKLYSQTEACVRMELLKIPKNIRELSVKDFLKLGGTFNPAPMDEATQLAMSVASSVGASHSLQTITEEAEETNSTLKKKRPARGRRGALQQNTSMNMPPPSTAQRRTRRTLRQDLTTPSLKGARPSVADTPITTPMFDRRLPNTPATLVRNARPGERLLYSVKKSLAGSPVIGHELSEPEMLVPVGRDKTLVIREDTDVDEILDLDMAPDTVAQLKRMQELLSKICQHQGLVVKK